MKKQRVAEGVTAVTVSNALRNTEQSRVEEIREDKKESSAATDFQKVYDAGSDAFPQLATQNTSAIHQWLNAGCSIELDILPELERQKGRQPRSWGYFTGGIMDAKATRERLPPVGKSRGYQKQKEPLKANVFTI
jgi:hypothetical protein